MVDFALLKYTPFDDQGTPVTKSTLGFVYDPLYLEHRPPAGHPERPERLAHLVHSLKRDGLWDALEHIAPAAATDGQLLAVHAAGHIDYLRRRTVVGGGPVDDAGETFISERSLDAALLAAGGVVSAIDAVLEGKMGAAFCAVRPPGHHAEREKAMGFCLFNNVAVGARHARFQHGVDRVAILDWDVHHGNGTQHIFEDDPTVLYISLHQYPFYPGTGARHERGVGPGEGFTLNFPLPAGTGEAVYLSLFEKEIVPALERFRPGLLLLSAGFDAHQDDPLANMALSAHSFGKFTDQVKGIAPIVSVLEGGYDLEALSLSVEEHLRALMGP
jgi:acetoin utilization deacetylase AcuC-like enzyme